ncbi:MAG: TOBE domain-containing protein, partial [Pseudomonadota bacterium]
LAPSYEQKTVSAAARNGRLVAIAGPGADATVRIHQDAQILTAQIPTGAAVGHQLAPGRRAWVQVARGSVVLGDAVYAAGDGAAITGEDRIELAGREPAEVLLFDLP